MRETFAINAATASWCVAFLMSFPFTYEKAWIWITREKSLFWWNKLTLKRPIFLALANNRRSFFECSLSIEFAQKYYYKTLFGNKTFGDWHFHLNLKEQTLSQLLILTTFRFKKRLLPYCKNLDTMNKLLVCHAICDESYHGWRILKTTFFSKETCNKAVFSRFNLVHETTSAISWAKQNDKEVMEFADRGLIHVYLK